MKLHDLMDDAVADLTTAPADRLIARARRGGIRRRATMAVATLAACAAVGGGLYATLGGHGTTTAVDRSAAASVSASPSTAAVSTVPDDTVVATGRGTTGGLIAALLDQRTGLTFAHLAGENTFEGVSGPMTWGQVDVDATATVGINLQGLATFSCGPNGPKDPQACEDQQVKALEKCPVGTGVQHCTSRVLPNGDELMTYDGSSDHPAADDRVVHIAQLVSRSRGVRVVVQESGELFDTGQLAAVVEEPWWGARLPAALEHRVDGMSYSDVSGSTTVESSPHP